MSRRPSSTRLEVLSLANHPAIASHMILRPGLLKCNGEYVDSEVIYWKVVPGDIDFESPITPHHDEHHERFLTFAYDEGGW